MLQWPACLEVWCMMILSLYVIVMYSTCTIQISTFSNKFSSIHINSPFWAVVVACIFYVGKTMLFGIFLSGLQHECHIMCWSAPESIHMVCNLNVAIFLHSSWQHQITRAYITFNALKPTAANLPLGACFVGRMVHHWVYMALPSFTGAFHTGNGWEWALLVLSCIPSPYYNPPKNKHLR